MVKILYTSLLRKASIESVEIEGIPVDINAHNSVEHSSSRHRKHTETKDTQEVMNYERAVLDGVKALETGAEITVSLLHSLHETLLSDIPDERRETDTSMGASLNGNLSAVI